MGTDNVIPLRQTRSLPVEQLRAAFAEVLRLRALPQLVGLMHSLFEQIDDGLYTQAEKSASDTLQTIYFDAMRELRVLRESIVADFERQLAQGFDLAELAETVGIADAEDARQSGQMSLLRKEELEENLAVNSVAAKAVNRFHEQLATLDQRLATLLGRTELVAADNPAGPDAIAHAFRLALRRWEGDILVRLVVYKLFDKHFMEQLGPLYSHLDRVLADLGVSADKPPAKEETAARREEPLVESPPAVPPSAPPAPSAHAGVGTNLAGPPVREDEGVIQGAGIASALIGLLRNLLDAQREELGLPPLRVQTSGAPLEVVPRGELLEVLSRYQTAWNYGSPYELEALHGYVADLQRSLLESLRIDPRSSMPRQFASADRTAFDLVTMLFQFVLDDPLLPDAMKVLLSRLQIPVLKAALQDSGFLGNKNHPARSLVNSLGRAALTWEDDGDRSPESLYGRISTAVSRVLDEFDRDTGLFAEVEQEFLSHYSLESRNARIIEERLVQVAAGQERLSAARSRVASVLERHLHPGMPTPAHRILDKAWRDVLVLTLLREGEDSLAWRKAISVVERLVDSLRPRTQPWERQRVMREIPTLLNDLREGFASVSFDAVKTGRLLKELQQCHIASLRGQVAEDVESPGSAGNMPTTETVDQEALSRAEAFPIGEWIQFTCEKGATCRAKLAWRSEITDLLLFVNRRGRKSIELTRAGFAEMLRQGRAVELKGIKVPLLDRAVAGSIAVITRKFNLGTVGTA